jgi:hypothetical protein
MRQGLVDEIPNLGVVAADDLDVVGLSFGGSVGEGRKRGSSDETALRGQQLYVLPWRS